MPLPAVPLPALVGQSMGGSTVLGFASKYPDRVTALVMCDTTGSIDDPDIIKAQAEYQKTRPNTGLLDALSPGFRKRDPVHTFLYREVTALTLRLNNVPAPAPNSAPAPTPPPVRHDVRPVLAKKIPTLILVGAADALASPAVIEMLHNKMPGSQFVKIPDAGHSVYFEKPEEFNRTVMGFLKEHMRSSD